MPKLSLISEKVANLKLKIIALLLVAFLIVPVLAFSSHRNSLYVDDSASGSEDGSSSHPYKTIEKAMDHANSKTDIHVAKGTYEENIKVKDGVKLFGEDQEDVIIKADDSDKPVVTFKEDGTIDKFTIKGGKNGILVEKGGEVSIIKCTIKDSKKDGVRIESDEIKDSRMVSISKSIIKNSGYSGIFSQKRRLSIIENEITLNNKDGMDFEAGAKAWVADNRIVHNEKSGLKVVIDGSEVWIKHNTFKNNDREGVEVSFFGGYGRVDIAKSKFADNERFAVAKVQRFSFGNNSSLWDKYLTFDSRNEFYGNKYGNISNIFIVK